MGGGICYMNLLLPDSAEKKQILLVIEPEICLQWSKHINMDVNFQSLQTDLS